ncbi:putative carbohydrate esterase [Capsicum chacoense]
MAKSVALLMIMAICYLKAIASSQVNIFLLAGQSNMSGLGGVVMNIWDGIIPPECSPNPAILKLGANLQWVEASEPLHADIDVNVTCGIGPGMPFANSLLNKTSSLGIVGLVPCAMAGNRISQWQKGTFLYNQLVKRTKAATLQEFGVIRAMLWYQGESDTVRPSDANTYKGKMQQFFTDLRSDIGMPELLIIQVALASGLNYTETVREAQLYPDLANVVTVDAKGLQLHNDNLHLTASSQVLLGHMMAHAFLQRISNTSSLIGSQY